MAAGSLRHLALVALVASAVLVMIPATAGAHAVLLDSEPADGADVEGAPDEIVLVFNEPMQPPATIEVTGPDGQAVAEGEADIDGERVVLPIDAVASDGEHTVAWRAVSADDHPIDGEFTFEVTDVEAGSSHDDAEATPTPTPDPTPTSEPTPTQAPEELDDLEQAQAGPPSPDGDDGGAGVLVWLLAGAAVIAVVATAGTVVAQRRRQTPDGA